jgi:hypothetical protein
MGAEEGNARRSLPVSRCTPFFNLPTFLLLNLYLFEVAAEPYETIAFHIPARQIENELDDAGYWNWSHWDPDTKQYSFQFMFRPSY